MTTKKNAKAAAKGGKTKPQRTPESVARPDDMPADVLEFIQAIDDYKRCQQRPFPSWSEVLEVIKELGYHRSA
ncbi:MAG: hypothetical protein QF724_13620 [Planctomycetota bacterium]|jgi:hypothetical protein|nr:hypothetical protein [Planctomycetota bacterium]MDP6956256.1 hypothetical protein [Planctomycetota bacterium]